MATTTTLYRSRQQLGLCGYCGARAYHTGECSAFCDGFAKEDATPVECDLCGHDLTGHVDRRARPLCALEPGDWGHECPGCDPDEEVWSTAVAMVCDPRRRGAA